MEKLESINLKSNAVICSKSDFSQASWDEIHSAIDELNAIGKEVNFTIFKTYSSLTVEAGGKFVKNYNYAHAEYVTSEQTSKEATFNLIIHFNVNYIGKNLVES